MEITVQILEDGKGRTGRREPAQPAGLDRTARSTEKLRTTVDLSAEDHRRLRGLARRLADDLGVVEVPRRSVWLALLAELDVDDELYARVRERIRM